MLTSRPTDSAATLSSTTNVTTSFVADVAGSYQLRLTATNTSGSDTTTQTIIASASGGNDDLYLPDNGPTHESGNVVNVCSEAQILSAISNASAGDVITVCPGTFNFNQLISVNRNGTAPGRIFLRAETLGTVTFNLTHIENFKIGGKFWIFENIVFFGNCNNSSACEHAFHIVGDADDLIFRNNEVVNFASHVKLNGTVVGSGPGKAFADRVMFINNFWHNTKYVANNVPHNILNIDGGKDHVVRGNIFADYSAPANVPKSASAVYPKASTLRMLIEQNLIVCEKVRTSGETTRGIQLGDGAPATICDGDVNQDGTGDCVENGQSQELIVRNNIVMNCDNGGSSAGIMVGSDRESMIHHNTVYNTGSRQAGWYFGHPNHDTYWRYNILEDGINTNSAERPLNEANNIMPSFSDMNAFFVSPMTGDFSAAQAASILEQNPTVDAVTHDFCGYPRGATADLGAIEYSTAYNGTACATIIKSMYDRIP
ncbi:MAG: hypothetical protein HKM24_07975 [Gammaproteobacteria bacterium]|nr:hypothetical protein [Gammaproteobacteria bacterium]